MRQVLLPALLAMAVALPPLPLAAQTIEQRFERWFGPPVNGAQGQRPSRPTAQAQGQAQRRSAPPPASAVPLPSERPAEQDAAPDASEAAAPAAAPEEVSPPAEEAAAEAVAPVAEEPSVGEAPPAEAAGMPAAETVPVPGERPAPEAEPEAEEAPEAEPVEAAPAPVDEPQRAADEAPERAEEAPAANDEPSEQASPAEAPEDAEPPEPEPEPAYVSPERARTTPEETAPETPDAAVTPVDSVEAAKAIEDARNCEAELEARGAVFTLEPTISEGECGVLRPLALTRTSTGVAVSPATAMLCRTALSFDIWVAEGVEPAAREILDEEAPQAIRHASTYVCRDRASERGISEHARGSAIDIAAFEWEGREPIVVERQDPGSQEDRFLATIRRTACGPFRTVIGPGTDEAHSDHFHFDIAARRNDSTYCR